MKTGTCIDDLDSHWHKVLALVMWKNNVTVTEFTAEDIQAFQAQEPKAVLCDTRGGRVLSVKLMDLKEAEKIAREANLS